MKIILYKYIFINLFSFLKRFFLDPSLYGILTFLPLFAIPAIEISKSGLLISIFLSLIAVLTSNFSLIFYLTPFFLLMVFKNQFSKISYGEVVESTKWFLFSCIIYAFLQIYLGFFPHEIKWIYSDLSIVKEQNVFVPGKTIRPFSVFASNPEFSLFCCIYLLKFIRDKNYPWILTSFTGLIISGSRGVMIAFILAYLIVYVLNVKSKLSSIFFSSFTIAFIAYGLLLYGAPYFYSISEDYSTSRLLLYGSFFARFDLLLKVTEGLSLWDFIYPRIYTPQSGSITIFDNLYLTLVFNFGIIGFYIFWNYFSKVNGKESLFFLSMFICYGFFGDMIYSFYLMFIFSVGIFSRKISFSNNVKKFELK